MLNEHLYGTHKFQVEDRDTSTTVGTVKPGEILNKFGTGAGTTAAASGNLAAPCIDPGAGGIGQDGTDLLLGIAKEESDETASVDGHVIAYLLGLGTRLRGKATTKANMNTQALLFGLELENITIDGITTKAGNRVTTPYTIDENDTKQKIAQQIGRVIGVIKSFLINWEPFIFTPQLI